MTAAAHLLAIAKRHQPTEEEACVLPPALADETGEYEQTLLDSLTFQELLHAGFLSYCGHCTRHTIIDCADVVENDDSGDYTAAEYHLAQDHSRACIIHSGILVSGMIWSIYDHPCQDCQGKPRNWYHHESSPTEGEIL